MAVENAGSVDHVPDLGPWLGNTFNQRRVSDFHMSDIKDLPFQFPGFVTDDEVSFYGPCILY